MYVYILHSLSAERYYIGATDDFTLRLAQHNAPETNPSRWTRGGALWDLVFQKRYSSKRSALRAERYVKNMKSRDFLAKLISGEYVLPDFKE
jgi:putative endonuclease